MSGLGSYLVSYTNYKKNYTFVRIDIKLQRTALRAMSLRFLCVYNLHIYTFSFLRKDGGSHLLFKCHIKSLLRDREDNQNACQE